jgi:hypothetical protein
MPGGISLAQTSCSPFADQPHGKADMPGSTPGKKVKVFQKSVRQEYGIVPQTSLKMA